MSKALESIKLSLVGANGTANLAAAVDDIEDLQSAAVTTSGEPVDDDDLFDPERLRIKQDFSDDIGVKAILKVPIRKPSKQTFFRVHTAPEYRFVFALLELKEARETYVILPQIASQLSNEVSNSRIFTCIDRSGNLFLWPVKLPPSDGRTNDWHDSACRIAVLAMEKWVRMQSNMIAGCYEALTAPGNLPDPQWPEITPKELLMAGFKGRLIKELGHPVLQKLRGEI